jgi:hypothetical protein
MLIEFCQNEILTKKPSLPDTGWHRETVKFEIIKKNEGNLQNFI